MSEALVLDAGVEYPSSDGRPVAETPLHYRRLADAAHALGTRFDAQPDAYVGVNMLVYDQPGNPKRHLSPDIFVAFGAQDREREIYKLWEEETPVFVLEVTSKTTRREDERKKSRYSSWGVAEYFLYDPRGEYVEPALKGFELAGGRYRAMRDGVLPNGKPGFASKTLGLGLWLDGLQLRFYDPETDRTLSTPMEAEQAGAEAATVRAVAEHARLAAKAAREEAAAAREEAKAAREETAAAREEAAAAREEAAAETARRRQLEAELAELKNR